MSKPEARIPTWENETPRVIMGTCGAVYITVAKDDKGRIVFIDMQGKDLKKDCMLWARAAIRQAVHKFQHGAKVDKVIGELMKDDTPCRSDSSALKDGYRSCLYAMCQVILNAEKREGSLDKAGCSCP